MKPHHLFSTKAKRKAWAAIVSDIATDALGFGVSLCPDHLDRDCFRFELAAMETDRGPVSYINFEVNPHGVSVHSRFGMPRFAPAGSNPYSGKCNDYFFPDAHATPNGFRDYLETGLRKYLANFRIRPGITRADRPGMQDYFRAELAKMEAEKIAAQ